MVPVGDQPGRAGAAKTIQDNARLDAYFVECCATTRANREIRIFSAQWGQ